MEPLRVISADSHMTEPPDLWTTRLDKQFQDRAPHVVEDKEKPGHFFIAPGITPFPVAGGFSTGRSGEELRSRRAPGLIGLSRCPELVGFVEQGGRSTVICVKRSDYRRATGERTKPAASWPGSQTKFRYRRT